MRVRCAEGLALLCVAPMTYKKFQSWPQSSCCTAMLRAPGADHMLVAHIREAMEEASDTAQVPA